MTEGVAVTTLLLRDRRGKYNMEKRGGVTSCFDPSCFSGRRTVRVFSNTGHMSSLEKRKTCCPSHCPITFQNGWGERGGGFAGADLQIREEEAKAGRTDDGDADDASVVEVSLTGLVQVRGAGLQGAQQVEAPQRVAGQRLGALGDVTGALRQEAGTS